MSSKFQTKTGTADAQIPLEPPALPTSVSDLFSGYLGRDPDNHPGGVSSADLIGVQTNTSGPEMPQVLGPAGGDFVFDHYNSALGRTPDGTPTTHDFNFTMQDFPSPPAAGSDVGSVMPDFDFLFAREAIPDPFGPRAFAGTDASHVDLLPAVQALLPAVQVDILPAVQTGFLPAVQAGSLPAVQMDFLPAVQEDFLPAVQVFASDWLWV